MQLAINRNQNLKKLLRYLKPFYSLLLIAIVLMLFSASVDILMPKLLQNAIDNHIAKGDIKGLMSYVSVIALVVVVSTIAVAIRMRLVTQIGQKAIKNIRTDLFSHIQQLPAAFFDKMPVGKIMTRLTSDVDSLARLFEAGIVSMIVDSVMLVGIIVVMFYMNVKLALLLLSIMPILIYVTFFLRPIILDTEDRIREETSKLNSSSQEIISGVRVIQAFNAEEYFSKRFDTANKELRDSSLRSLNVWSYYWPLVDIAYFIALALVIYVGGKMAYEGIISVGTVLAFILYAGRFFHPLRSLAQASRIIQKAITGADRIVAILETPKEATGDINLPPIKGEVNFETVNFSYDPGEPVLTDFNLKANPGEMIALVGHTGAGKTSVINLLCRFYEPDSGRILVDGIDITKTNLAGYRSQVGLVLQDPFLFSGSLRENLQRGKPTATDEEMEKALQIVGLKEENGLSLDLLLTERGQNLSFGQRQLVSFARALLADPRILILDEATAHVDTITEHHIQQALKVLLKGRTSFVIAHRLSTIREANQIVVLGQGRILEMGTHQELVAAGKEYFTLLQAATT